MSDTTTRTAGTLTLVVTHDGERADRQVYQYRVTDSASGLEYVDNDLQSGMFDPVDAPAMLRTLAAFLSAAADSYSYAMRECISLDQTENGTMFPVWLTEAAYTWADELTSLTITDDEL